MKDLFLSYGIDLSVNQLEKFRLYYDILKEYNEKFNITAITDKEEVYKKHFIDSILGGKYINSGKLIDIGSGGGFPAIPLKIVNENLTVTLVEATGKKCVFITNLIKELGLINVTVINDRAEMLIKKDGYRENFDFCTARAVAKLNTLSEYCIPFVKKGGYFIAFKGDSENEIYEAKNAIDVLGGRIDKVDNYALDGAKRSLVVIKKIKHTDKKYPRGNGKERKDPL